MIDGLDHLHILCGDVEKSVRYFEEVFGGEVESRGELRGFPMIRMNVKGVFVNLMGTDPKAAALEVGKGAPIAATRIRAQRAFQRGEEVACELGQAYGVATPKLVGEEADAPVSVEPVKIGQKSGAIAVTRI